MGADWGEVLESHLGEEATGYIGNHSGAKEEAAKGVENVKIEYDREADALYIQLRQVHPEDNIDIEEGVTVDLDKDGHVVGIEILDAIERLGLESLLNVTIENMPLEKAPA